MLPDQVLNPGPLIYKSGALPTALRSPTGKVWGKELDDNIFKPVVGTALL